MHLKIKRGRSWALALLTAAAVLCVGGASSAAAATPQHWASAQVLKHGQATTFSGNQAANLNLTWKFAGAQVEFGCQEASTGTVENPVTEGVGKLSSSSFSFTNCVVAGEPACHFHNNAIEFNALTPRVYSEAGKQWIEYRPTSGTELAHVSIEGSGCSLAGSMGLRGAFSVYEKPSGGNLVLQVTQVGHQMELGELPFGAQGEFEYRTSAGEKLYLGGETQPHWYANSTAWTNLAAGESQSVGSGSSLSLAIKGKMFGVEVELVCSGAGDGFQGSAEDPAGGGAGVLSGSLSLGHCVVAGLESKCTVAVTGTAPLSGVAGEGIQKFALSPVGGKALITMNIEGKGCAVQGIVKATGKLAVTSRGEGLLAFTSGAKSETELRLNEEKATSSGSFALESSSGRSLRLQE